MPHAASTFCATLADEWIRGGIRHAVIAPGSRSTPLAVALAERRELHVHIAHDERVAGFIALGIGIATGTPAIVLCTSGTAAAHFHAEVIEAHQAHIPLIVCTADRPPELRETGAAQTITQTGLYGGAVRWFHDPGVPDLDVAHTWRGLAARAATDAVVGAGPVHLNLSFREPLLGKAAELPPAREHAWSSSLLGEMSPSPGQLSALVRALDHARGVIVAGRCRGLDPTLVHRLAAELSWPVFAEPRSGARTAHATTVASFDALLRARDFAAESVPDVVLRIGEPPASKVLSQWVTASNAAEIHIGGLDEWADPERRLSIRAIGTTNRILEALLGHMRGSVGTPWLARWRRGEHAAQQAIESVTSKRWCEPSLARTVAATVPEGGHLVVSSSMPVRDIEWYMAPRHGLTVHSNRGANGIDGVISTGIGVALATAAPTVVYLGDLAFIHDSSALAALARRPVRLRLVVSDNDGGAIFSFLPQATQLDAARFEQLFGTPHGTDIASLARAHGLTTTSVVDHAALHEALSAPVAGVDVVVARFDRTNAPGDHAAIHDAVAEAVSALTR